MWLKMRPDAQIKQKGVFIPINISVCVYKSQHTVSNIFRNFLVNTVNYFNVSADSSAALSFLNK